jgi:PTH1 family peptidyl-tRNA hydrolase
VSRIADALNVQAKSCVALGSPFMGRLLSGLAQDWPDTPLAQRLAEWPGEIGPAGHSVPLRLASGLHALVLTGQADTLAAVHPPNDAPVEALIAAVHGAMARHETFLDDWMRSPPQTNELRRSAVLIPAALLLTERFGLPLRLSEMGASGGLNLLFDRFALRIGDEQRGARDPALVLDPAWTGPLPPAVSLQVADRRGVDLNPLDPANPADALRLVAYLWPDQSERIDRTRRAMAIGRAPVDRGDAADWIGTRMAGNAPGVIQMIYTTIAWQYFPPEAQARALAAIETAGAAATEDAPVAWVALEDDGQRPGAGITLRLWPGDRSFSLGRADFHGRWVNWTAPPL